MNYKAVIYTQDYKISVMHIMLVMDKSKQTETYVNI